jgi:predicted RNA binding protein YcfA (HicA-like mRNA interferase family)
MARLPALSGPALIALLRRHGFAVVSQEGSHVKLRKGETTVIVPVHGSRSLKRPTMLGILRDAGLDPDEL